jgi:CheY-like chemotaxis protein
MAESDPHEQAHTRTVKLRLAIEADDEPRARAIATEVLQAMDVAAVAGEMDVTRSANRQPFWNIVTDLDMSAVTGPEADALTRFRWVIRNLPGVSFISPAADDGPSMMYQWLPDEWNTSMNFEETVHPAVRAAGVWIRTNTGADAN